MEQTGNEIISGVRCLWREWQGICSNIWEVIRCESPTCVLQQPCFSHTHIKLHKLQHGEKWRWERLHAWAAEADAEAFGVGYRRNAVLCYISSFPLSAPLTTASLDWMGHNHNNWKNNNLWIFESIKCWCPTVFFPPIHWLVPLIHHSPVALILEYLSLSSGFSPLLAAPSFIHEITEQNSSSASMNSLSPVL